MAFEDYQDLPDLTGAGLRRTDYGPGFAGGTPADKREFTGINQISLRSGDVALPPAVAAKYGLRPGAPFTYQGQPYRYADNPSQRVGNVFDVYHPRGSQGPSPGTVTDAPASVDQGRPAQSSLGNITDNPFQAFGETSPAQSSPGNVTDNPWLAYTPPVGGPNELTMPYNQPLYPSGPETTFAPYNPPTSEGMTPTDAGFTPPPTNDGMVPTDPNQYFNAPGFNVPTGEGMTPTDPGLYQSSNVPTNESMIPTGPSEYRGSTPYNVPTDEGMTPTDPSQYRYPDATAPDTSAPPADTNIPTGGTSPDPYGGSAVSYYPTGDGGYTPLDAFGNPIGTPTPGSNPFVGGAFATTPGNINLGGFGQGSAGNVNFGGNYDYFGMMSLNRLRYGQDPSLGFAGFNNPLKGGPGPGVLPTSQWGGTGFAGDFGTSFGTGAVNPDFPGRVPK